MDTKELEILLAKIEELKEDLELYKHSCSMKDEEINRLMDILDANGIPY